MTKEQLQAYRNIGREIRQILNRLDALETAMYNPKAQQLTGMPSAPSKDNPLEQMVIQRAELQRRYSELLTELLAEQLTIEAAIEQAPPAARTLLRYRYIDGLKWEEICVKMNYSWRQMHRLHAQALDALKEEGDT